MSMSNYNQQPATKIHAKMKFELLAIYAKLFCSNKAFWTFDFYIYLFRFVST